MGVLEAARTLRDACDKLSFEDAPYVYNPLRYAWDAHEQYARKYGAAPRRAVLVGMNPGPWGMGQTGVPFGDVAYVRDWMGITAACAQPARVHPKRPVQGFACARREPSGSRLYGWAKERFGAADAFFAEFFITNYCPLLFYADAGTNLTPPQLRKADQETLHEACDRHIAQVIRALQPEFIIGVGAFAMERAQAVVDANGLPGKVGTVLHPSPASPAANRAPGWAPQAETQLVSMGVLPRTLVPDAPAPAKKAQKKARATKA